MPSWFVLALLISLLTVPPTPLSVEAHGGGLDAYGCHHDRKAGTYHCHRGEFAGRSFASQAEMLQESYTAVPAQEAFNTLKAARSLKCTFSNGTAADWSGGLMNIKNDNETMVLHFDAIDWKRGTARSVGNQGASNETVFMTPKGLTFIEQTNSGNFTFTTVFNLFKKGTNAFIAVTSRRMNMMLTPIPSQYHGTCVVWPSQ